VSILLFYRENIRKSVNICMKSISSSFDIIHYIFKVHGNWMDFSSFFDKSGVYNNHNYNNNNNNNLF
jgi:hypothetical protein